MVDLSPNTRLSRADLSLALTSAGFPIATGTLARLGYLKKGPEYFLFGGRAVYTWESALRWAKERAKFQTDKGHYQSKTK